MRTTQQKFLAECQRIADERKLDLIVDLAFANRGILSFQRASSFTPIFTVGFDFQHTYASFDGVPNPVTRLGVTWPCVKSNELDGFVQAMTKALVQKGG
jgi:hypothetical protein